MRVLHVIPSLDSRDGGPTIALGHMARCTSAEGIEISVATTIDAKEASTRNFPIGQPVKIDNWTCYYFPRQSHFYKFSWPLFRWLRHHAKSYELIHVHAVFSFAPTAACWVARRSGTPYVVSPHGLLNEWGMQQRKRLKALSFDIVERPLLNAASAIHYTSTAEQREAEPLNLTPRPVMVPLGIEISAFQHLPQRDVFDAKYPEARNRRCVLFLSRLDPKKGVEVLLQAWKQVVATFPDALLIIAGSGADDYAKSLFTLAKDLELHNQVLWTGFLGHEEKCTAFGRADIFVLPSKSESFGVALLEAMAAGVPCISTAGVALGEEAGSAGAVRLAEYDADSLATVIGGLLESPADRTKLGHAGRAFAEAKYSLEAMGANLTAMYKELAK